ncbi:MAG: hypothetical protein H7246_19170 [Phycisphaerae bacterium]|nr:hypothetical protein [Saprospiraceae bacterium]
MKKILAFTLFTSFACLLFAQAPSTLLNVHVSPGFSDFLTTEVPFVNFVSDRRLSDLQFQQLAEPVGNGAVRYRYLFFGYGKFEGQNDTITWHTDPGENPGSIREKGLQAFKRGLLPYLIQTPLIQSIDYKVGPEYDYANTPDHWNKWTFSPSLDLSNNVEFFKDNNPLSGEVESRKGGLNVAPSFSFWRIGEKWRVNGRGYYNYSDSWKKSSGGVGDFSKKQESSILDLGGAYSLSARWSIGMSLSRYFFRGNGPFFSTNKPQNGVAFGLEYSFLPYRDYFRKRLLVGYTWGASIEDGSRVELEKKLYRGHQVYAVYAKTARWGYFSANLDCAVDYVPYEWTRFSLSSEAHLGFNMGKNIYLTLNLDWSWGNNNYNLAFLGGNPVVQSRNVRSGRYNYSVGVDYYFGSGYRNTINPRLISANRSI